MYGSGWNGTLWPDSHADAAENFASIDYAVSRTEVSLLGSCLFGKFKDFVIYLSILGMTYHCEGGEPLNVINHPHLPLYTQIIWLYKQYTWPSMHTDSTLWGKRKNVHFPQVLLVYLAWFRTLCGIAI